MPAVVPFIPAIIGVAGSLIGASSQKKAAKQQAKAQQAAIDTQRELVQPFVDFGTGRLNPLNEFVDNGANFADTQAFKDIVNTQKARGQNLSGNTLTELARFNAVNFRPQRFNELFRTAALGQNAAVGQATNIGGLQQNIGDIQGRGTLGAGANFASALGSLGAIDFSSLLNRSSLQPNNLGNFNTGFNTFNPQPVFDRTLLGG